MKKPSPGRPKRAVASPTPALWRAALLLAVLPLLAAPRPAPVPESDDPGADGWPSEALSRRVEARLAELGELLVERTGWQEALESLAAPGLETGPLAPASPRTVLEEPVFEGAGLTVLRAESGAARGEILSGPEGLGRALEAFLRPFGEASDLRFKSKVVEVEMGSGEALTRQRIEASGISEAESVEVHALWRSRWRIAGDELRLLSLASEDWELSRFRSESSSPTLFVDVTASALAGDEALAEQLSRGPSYWLGRLEAAIGTDLMGHSGLALADADGDGLEDLYLLQHGGLPNRLLLQRPDGTVRDASALAGLDILDRSQSALFADFDNDGDQDLALSTAKALLILANDGRGRFRPVRTFEQASYAYSLAAADIDSDSDLDLYAARYSPAAGDPVEKALDVPNPIPYHDAENGAPSFLFENRGDLVFHDATAETGLDADNRRWSFAASFEDYDNDGDQDLYVANDFGRNCLYENLGGRFRNVAAEAGVEDVASGMSVDWADADRDGWMDLYVGNMFSSAGSRITFQRSFRPDLRAATRRGLQRLARGNSLFLGRGDGTFRDASLEAGVSMGRWAWSSLFADLDNDGWEDLVVANGFLTAEDPDDL